jgi:uncharacterized membrane protein
MFMERVSFLIFTEDGGSMSLRMLPVYQIYWGRILEYLSVYILKKEAADSSKNRTAYVAIFAE